MILTDHLFIDGIEAVFRVALVLLQSHEEALLACDSFEQIMEYMKNSLSSLHTNQIGNIISQVSWNSLISIFIVCIYNWRLQILTLLIM